MKQLTETDFLTQVSSHEMRIIYDDGEDRHIRFRKPDTMSEYFDLVTWQNRLCYTGDMGTYVFSRMNDMFEFFRASAVQHKYAEKIGKTIYVNPEYWAEKLLATDSNGPSSNGVMAFDEELFDREMMAYVVKWMREHRDDMDKDQRRELWEELIYNVIDMDDDESGSIKLNAMRDFSHSVDDDLRFSFDPEWWMSRNRFYGYSQRFQWACYAIAWGIMQYDKWLEETPKVSAMDCVSIV